MFYCSKDYLCPWILILGVFLCVSRYDRWRNLIIVEAINELFAWVFTKGEGPSLPSTFFFLERFHWGFENPSSVHMPHSHTAVRHLYRYERTTKSIVIIDCRTVCNMQSGQLSAPLSKVKKGMRRSCEGNTWEERCTLAIKGVWVQRQQGLQNDWLQEW